MKDSAEHHLHVRVPKHLQQRLLEEARQEDRTVKGMVLRILRERYTGKEIKEKSNG